MRRSIRTKLFWGITLFIISFIIVLGFLNKQFLDDYYIYQKKKVLIESSQKIAEISEENPLEYVLILRRIEQNLGAGITVIDKNGNLKYSSLQRPLIKKDLDLPVIRRNFFKPQLKKEAVDEKYVFRFIQDKELIMNFLVLETMLQNGDHLMMRVPLTAIWESAAVANRFLISIGVAFIFLGSLWAYYYSKKFTRPIVQLNTLAQGMAKLDFNRKYIMDTGDEIDELGRSLNLLSQKLDNTISELKEKNEILQDDIARERKIDEMRKEFISSVSHELKTPISLIQGYAEGLQLNVAEDAENKDYYCNVIIDEAHKMDILVKDLLKLSQMEAGYNQLEETEFNLSELIHEVLQKFQTVFKAKEIELSKDIKEDILALGDKLKIEQVLFNYLNNAVNHVNETKEIIISMDLLADKIRVKVFNTGESIPQESLSKLWTSFYKVDKARTREYGGTGLGLSIVKAIQEQHGCSYGVSNLENGVEFWFDVKSVKASG